MKLIMNKGMLIAIIDKPLGMPKKRFMIWDKPPTPPGAMLYGRRNQEYPMAKNTEAKSIPAKCPISLFMRCFLLSFFMAKLLIFGWINGTDKTSYYLD
jgi:hypothetical protein